MRFGRYPHVQSFESLPDLLAQLVVLDPRPLVAAMREVTAGEAGGQCHEKVVASFPKAASYTPAGSPRQFETRNCPATLQGYSGGTATRSAVLTLSLIHI